MAVDKIALDPAATYTLSAYLKTDKIATLFANFHFFSNQGDDSRLNAGGPGQRPVTATDWTQFEFRLFPSERGNFAIIEITLAVPENSAALEPGESATLYIDDLSLRELLD